MRIGILGAAKIAPAALVKPARRIEGVEAFGVAARDKGRAEAFAREHGMARVFDSYDDLCSSDEVDAVYNALPISHHCTWTLRALEQGKPVLCEKALSANAAEAERMARTAADTGLVLFEAFHWRYHPMAERMLAALRDGRLGRIRHIRACFDVPLGDPNDIRFQYATAGGATLDAGCYPVHMLRQLLGEEPEVVGAEAEVGPPDIDIAMRAQLRFPSGTEGEISCAMKKQVKFRMELVAEGDRGRMEATNPAVPQLGNQLKIEADGSVEEASVPGDTSYTYQLRAFARAVGEGYPVPTDAADAIKNMRTLDAIYEAAGLPLRGAP